MQLLYSVCRICEGVISGSFYCSADEKLCLKSKNKGLLNVECFEHDALKTEKNYKYRVWYMPITHPAIATDEAGLAKVKTTGVCPCGCGGKIGKIEEGYFISTGEWTN